MNLGDKNSGVSIAFFSIDHSVIYKVGKVRTYSNTDYLLHINALYIFINLPKIFDRDQVS